MEHQIRSYLLTTPAASGVSKLADHDSLLAAGVIDSVAMIDLIAHLETTYKIHVLEDDMTPENFDSVAAIARYVQGKRGA